jgi:hypothetical protein
LGKASESCSPYPFTSASGQAVLVPDGALQN